MRSDKPKQKKQEAKKEVLSEDQIDIQRYLGLQLTEAEERKQRGQWRSCSYPGKWEQMKQLDQPGNYLLTNYQTVEMMMKNNA